MSQSVWRELDGFLEEPWKSHTKEVVPYWSYFPYWRRHPLKRDLGYERYPREWLDVPRDFNDFERQVRELERKLHNDIWTPTMNDGFYVCLDVLQYSPHEITVRTTNYTVTVEGRHEERQDEHGYISRQFTRRYTLPPDCDPTTVTSDLSQDGFLTIKARALRPIPPIERYITIQRT